MNIREWQESDWEMLMAWAEADETPTTREYVEAHSPYRGVAENGDGPLGMVGWSLADGVPVCHIVINPEKRSLKTFNAVYDRFLDKLRECGYTKAVAMVPAGARIGKLVERKGWLPLSQVYGTEL